MHRYASPGKALQALLLENNWSLDDLAGKLAFSTYLTQKLLDDEVPMTAVVAGQLADVTGKPLNQWLGLYTKAQQAKTPIGRSLEV